jgi:tetratricopeptide (TPR) repeat protein
VRCVLAVVGVALAVANAALAENPVPPGEPAAAREQARLCERRNLAAGAAACRAALALGIGPQRRGPVREQLARHLVALEDWDALADHFRESVRLEPHDAVAWQRLGLTLLFAVHQPAEAASALEEAVRLAPGDADVRAGLAQALAVVGRAAEAAAAFEAALRLDPAVLDGRPAARAAFEAARRGASWP